MATYHVTNSAGLDVKTSDPFAAAELYNRAARAVGISDRTTQAQIEALDPEKAVGFGADSYIDRTLRAVRLWCDFT